MVEASAWCNPFLRAYITLNMLTYIKIYGPPFVEAVEELERIAIEMPEVCIMDTLIEGYLSESGTLGVEPSQALISEYFSYVPTEISKERCSSIISRSGRALGEYNFFFEWRKQPSREELNKLLKAIDEKMSTLGCRYSVSTKK